MQIVQQSTDILQGEDLHMVLEDFHLGVGYVRAELHEKLRFWQLLPWLFAGLAHRSESRAAAVAGKIHDLLSSWADPTTLPRLAQKWLAPE